MFKWNRRQALAGTASLIASTVLSGSTAPQVAAQPQSLRVRRDVGGMQQNDPVLQAYRDAVNAMHALPDNDPRNWRRQAQIHRAFCPHGNWYFLPWHRYYLLYFEQICRELSAFQDFALPYWNWTEDRQVPAAFWGTSNPLDPAQWNDPDPLIGGGRPREAGPNDSLPDFVVGSSVIDAILREPDFQQFASYEASSQRPTMAPFGSAGALESRPHNSVHRFIGGHMGDLLSPLDPIFWLHHCNIDRLWQAWNSSGKGNTANPNWLNYRFTNNFVELSGALQDVAVRDCQDIGQLGYMYDSLGPGVGGGAVIGGASAVTLMAATQPPPPSDVTPLKEKLKKIYTGKSDAVIELYRPAGISVNIGGAVPVPIELRQTFRFNSDLQTRRVLASLRDISPPASGGGYYVELFVNCPYLSALTPTSDPHFTTVFSFFGGEKDGGMSAHHMSYTVDITDTLVNLNRLGRPAKEVIEVQFVAVPYLGREPKDIKFQVGTVEIATS